MQDEAETTTGAGGEDGGALSERDLEWLKRQKSPGHCGEENGEARWRRERNDRINRLLAALAPKPGAAQAGGGRPKPYVLRNEPGHWDSGGKVVNPFDNDDQMEEIITALSTPPDAAGDRGGDAAALISRARGEADDLNHEGFGATIDALCDALAARSAATASPAEVVGGLKQGDEVFVRMTVDGQADGAVCCVVPDEAHPERLYGYFNYDRLAALPTPVAKPDATTAKEK